MTEFTNEEIESMIVQEVIDSLLANGFAISVFDGKEFVLDASTDKDEITGSMFSTNMDILYVSPSDNIDYVAGNVHFIYGNSGWDVIHDHSMSLLTAMLPAIDLAERLTK